MHLYAFTTSGEEGRAFAICWYWSSFYLMRLKVENCVLHGSEWKLKLSDLGRRIKKLRQKNLHKNGTTTKVYLNEVSQRVKFLLLNVIYRVYLLRKKSEVVFWSRLLQLSYNYGWATASQIGICTEICTDRACVSPGPTHILPTQVQRQWHVTLKWAVYY